MLCGSSQSCTYVPWRLRICSVRLLIRVRNGDASIREYGQKFCRNGLGSICAAHHIVRNMEGVKQPIHKPFQLLFFIGCGYVWLFPSSDTQTYVSCFFFSLKKVFSPQKKNKNRILFVSYDTVTQLSKPTGTQFAPPIPAHRPNLLWLLATLVWQN